MYDRLVTYSLRIAALLDANDASTDWRAVLSEHVVQISFFQHERLIHLLVTLAFALMELASAITTVLVPQPLTLALMALFLVLLIPYIVHYYHLENGTQKLYGQYDELVRRANNQSNEQSGNKEHTYGQEQTHL